MKYKGTVKLSYELLKSLIGLDENEEISNVHVDPERETVNIIVSSNARSTHSMEVIEGAVIPTMYAYGLENLSQRRKDKLAKIMEAVNELQQDIL